MSAFLSRASLDISSSLVCPGFSPCSSRALFGFVVFGLGFGQDLVACGEVYLPCDHTFSVMVLLVLLWGSGLSPYFFSFLLLI